MSAFAPQQPTALEQRRQQLAAKLAAQFAGGGQTGAQISGAQSQPWRGSTQGMYGGGRPSFTGPTGVAQRVLAGLGRALPFGGANPGSSPNWSPGPGVAAPLPSVSQAPPTATPGAPLPDPSSVNAPSAPAAQSGIGPAPSLDPTVQQTAAPNQFYKGGMPYGPANGPAPGWTPTTTYPGSTAGGGIVPLGGSTYYDPYLDLIGGAGSDATPLGNFGHYSFR